MPDPTLDDIVRLTDRFYAAAFDETLWDEAIVDLARTLDAPHYVFASVDTSGASYTAKGNCTPHFERTYADFDDQNPYRGWMARQQVGTSFTEEKFVTRSEFERTAFYNEWLTPQELETMLITRIGLSGSAGVYLNFGREKGRGPFDSTELSVMTRLMPVLSRTSALRALAGGQSVERRSEALERVSVGMFVTDRAGRILQANSVAQRVAELRDGLGSIGGRLVALRTGEQSKLAALIQHAAPRTNVEESPGGDMMVSSALTGAPRYALAVRPLPLDEALGLSVPRAVLVVVQDLVARPRPGFEEAMRSLFGFSEKEAELAAALVAGRSLSEAATERGIGMPTARTQLTHIFRKNNTTQQSQLVALLLSILPVA